MANWRINQDSDERFDPDLDKATRSSRCSSQTCGPIAVRGRAASSPCDFHAVPILVPQPMTIHTGEYPDQRQYDYQFLRSTGTISSRAMSMTGTWFSWAETRRRR